MNTPIRHHYLPEFYLNSFCRDGRLWIYDKEQKKIRRDSPVNTCVQRHYYTLENEDGSKNTIVESGLAELEGKTRPVIDKISKRIHLFIKSIQICVKKGGAKAG